MSEITPFNATSNPIITLQQYNALLDHGLEKTAAYIIRKTGGYYEAIKGGTSSGAGTISFGGSENAGTVDGTSSSAVIIACIDAVVALGYTHMETVLLKGEMALDASIAPTTFSYVRLHGIQCKLNLDANVDDYMITVPAGSYSFEISGIRFYGNGANQADGGCIKIESGAYDIFNFVIKDCELWSFYGKGISCLRTAHSYMHNLLVDSASGGTVYGTHGISISSAIEMHVGPNIIMENIGTYFYLYGSNRCEVKGITGTLSAYDADNDIGFHSVTNEGCTFSDLIFRYMDEYCFSVTTTYNCHFNNCIGEYAQQFHGISVYDSYDNTFTGCSFGLPDTINKAGIYVSDGGGATPSVRNTFSACTVRGDPDVGDYGIYESGSAGDNIYCGITFDSNVDTPFRINPATLTSVYRNSNARLGRGETRTYSKTVNFDDGSPVTVCTVYDGYAVTDCWVKITTVFDGGGVIDIGDGGNDDGFLATANIDETAAAYYGMAHDERGDYLYDAVNKHDITKVYAGGDTVDCKITPAAATQGVAVVYVTVTNIGG